MPVAIGGKSIIPGPFVSITKDQVRSEDGGVRRRLFSLNVRGKVMAWAGSPRSDGSWWAGGAASPPPNEAVVPESRLAALRNKMASLQAAFSADGQAFEIIPFDGTQSIKCYPRVKNIEFQEGKWADYVDFVIQLEASEVFFGGVPAGGGLAGIGPEETWAVELANENTRTYRVSHTASSQQRATFDETGAVTAEGWQNAQAVVLPHVGASLPAGLLPPQPSTGYAPFNYSRVQQVDEAAGRFSVTENWLYAPDQPYVEEFSVSSRTQEGVRRVSVEGTITGLAAPNPALTPAQYQAQRFSQAQAGWTSIKGQLLTRAQNYSGFSLNPVSLNETEGYNPVAGTVTYNLEFDSRPSSLVPGSLSETLTLTQQNPSDIFAQLVVLGRPAGPVLQGIGTKTARQLTASLEVVMPPWSYGQAMPAAPDVTPALLAFMPGGAFVSKDDMAWVARNGRYNRSITWTYE